jgi:hypothetical protein
MTSSQHKPPLKKSVDNRSRQLNPCDPAFFKSRGFSDEKADRHASLSRIAPIKS